MEAEELQDVRKKPAAAVMTRPKKKLTCRFKGKSSRSPTVMVTDKSDQQEVTEIDNERVAVGLPPPPEDDETRQNGSSPCEEGRRRSGTAKWKRKVRNDGSINSEPSRNSVG